MNASASRSCVHHSTQHGSSFNCASALTNASFGNLHDVRAVSHLGCTNHRTSTTETLLSGLTLRFGPDEALPSLTLEHRLMVGTQRAQMRRIHIRTQHSTCVLEELLNVDDLSMNGTCGHSTVFDDCRCFTIGSPPLNLVIA